MSGRAAAFGGIRGAASVSKRYRRFSPIPNTPISVPISRPSIVPFGWVGERLDSVIFEIREDDEGEFYDLLTLWKASAAERKLYEENAF